MEKKLQHPKPRVKSVNPKLTDLHKAKHKLNHLGLGVIHLEDGIIYEEKPDGSKKVVGTLKSI